MLINMLHYTVMFLLDEDVVLALTYSPTMNVLKICCVVHVVLTSQELKHWETKE